MTPHHKPEKLQVAVVGCGPIGALHAEAVYSHPAAELVAVCAPTKSHREAIARKYNVASYESLQQVLEYCEVQGIFVASPDGLHLEQTLQSLHGNCHVLCEKPLGYTASDTQRVCALASAKSLKVGVTYNRRYGFGYQQARRLLDEKAIGSLRHVWLQVSDGTPPPKVATRNDVIFWTLLGHHLDLLKFLGGQVRSVTAQLRSSRTDKMLDDVVVCFDFQHGGGAVLLANYRDGQVRTVERCEIFGSRGSIVVEDVTRRTYYYCDNPDSINVLRPNIFDSGDSFYWTLRQLIHDFIDSVVAGENPKITAADAHYTNQLAEAILKSFERKTVVHLKEFEP